MRAISDMHELVARTEISHFSRNCFDMFCWASRSRNAQASNDFFSSPACNANANPFLLPVGPPLSDSPGATGAPSRYPYTAAPQPFHLGRHKRRRRDCTTSPGPAFADSILSSETGSCFLRGLSHGTDYTASPCSRGRSGLNHGG